MTQASHLATDELDSDDVLAVLEGNPQAFTGIVDRYTDQIFNLAFRTLGNRDRAEEAVQEVFLKAFRALASFDPQRRIYPWLYSIALNHLRSLQRQSRRRHETNAIPLAEELVSSESHGSGTQPESQLLANAARDMVEDAMRQLKPVQRQAFVLRHVRELSTTDAARVMGIPENTLKTNLSRARKRLQKILGAHGITGG